MNVNLKLEVFNMLQGANKQLLDTESLRNAAFLQGMRGSLKDAKILNRGENRVRSVFSEDYSGSNTVLNLENGT